MFSTANLMLGTASVLILFAGVLAGLEFDRRRMKRLVASTAERPEDVERAWVSPPDAEGLRRLIVKTAGHRECTVSMDFDVDDAVRRFAQAGIRVGYEAEEGLA